MINITEEYKGRWASILINAGMDAQRFTGKHQRCDLCCEGKDCFRWIAGKETWYCNKCGVKSGINTYMEVTGLSFKESCGKIRGNKMEYKEHVIKKADPMIKLKRVHSKLKKVVEGDPVDLYLSSRGISIRPVDVLTGSGMPYYGGGKVPGIYDCMVSRITNVDGHLESYHIVYLTPEGRKIDNAQAKIIITPLTTVMGCSVKVNNGGEELAIAEGIETALKVSEDEEVTCWAGVSAGGLEKVIIPKSVKTIFIYADNDSSYTGQAAAYNLAKRLKVKGHQVKVFMPEVEDTDFLDEFNR